MSWLCVLLARSTNSFRREHRSGLSALLLHWPGISYREVRGCGDSPLCAPKLGH